MYTEWSKSKNRKGAKEGASDDEDKDKKDEPNGRREGRDGRERPKIEDMRCYNCDQKGHLKRDCKER